LGLVGDGIVVVGRVRRLGRLLLVVDRSVVLGVGRLRLGVGVTDRGVLTVGLAGVGRRRKKTSVSTANL
jgi:hypothetical protein